MKLPFWPNPKGYRDIDLGLKRVFDLLERVGNPHLKLPPTIHIAGTNGKGSTLAFLQAIFEEAGLKVHKYTSPHLVNFNERILLAGKEISDEFLKEVLSECKKAAEKSPEISVTFFEGITVAAFLAFSRIKADVLLLETGMGGRLDATNVLPEVLCSIITPISFDHQEFLGKTLKKIASEKAGIIKKNCPVFVGKQKKSAAEVITKKAEKMGSEVFIQQLAVGSRQSKNILEIGLIGKHQKDNAALAALVARSQKKFKISEQQIKNGLKKAFWPARLQKISSGKFFKILSKNFELYLDGSHNLQGAETIKKFLKEKKSTDSQIPKHSRITNKTKIFVIFSMLKDKDCEGFLKKIAGEIDELIALPIPNEIKSRSAKEISQIAKKVGIKSRSVETFEEAFLTIKNSQNSQQEIMVLVCGSLYLAGEFLSQNL